ncbi:hypothetical protein FN846DRAFT_654519 [Sphaerosporella brunnea]|uniref:Uncharacterized protein n=1 Tax=Sphaerosporella brunnea TaxID=1250544 RepID=A0A5J5F0H2_9PEZI|nr:hypothetical protein FN846DRAFT_654519 [Sphaerosporella brunnea]
MTSLSKNRHHGWASEEDLILVLCVGVADAGIAVELSAGIYHSYHSSPDLSSLPPQPWVISCGRPDSWKQNRPKARTPRAPHRCFRELALGVPGDARYTDKFTMEQCQSSSSTPAGRIVIDPEDLALQTAISRQEPTTDAIAVYSDGSRLEDEWCGCGAVTSKAPHLGPQQRGIRRRAFRHCHGPRARLTSNGGIIHLFTDAQAALKRLRDDKPDPGQWILARIANAEAVLPERKEDRGIPLGPRPPWGSWQRSCRRACQRRCVRWQQSTPTLRRDSDNPGTRG